MSPTRSLTRIATTALVMATLLGSTLQAADATLGARVVPAAVKKTKNLIKNPGAESGNGSSNGSVVNVPNWTRYAGTAATAVQYGASGGFPTSSTPGAPNRGHNFFAGGPSTASFQGFQQVIDVSKYRSAIDAGHATFVLKAWMGGYRDAGDTAMVLLEEQNGGGLFIDDAAVGPVTNTDRHNQTKFLMRTESAPITVGTRKIYVLIRFDYVDGSYNDGYADNLSLVLTGI